MMGRLKLWLKCDGLAHAYLTNIPNKVIVRCYCGRHIRPRLIPLESP